jgi:uncharacterized protein
VSDFAIYQKTLKQRQESHLEKLAHRREQGWLLAKQAAELLKLTYGAKQVILFGSLVHRHWFSATSDIDLAVWGLDSLAYLTAIARLQDLSSDFKVDLVRMEQCPSELEAVIFSNGQLL